MRKTTMAGILVLLAVLVIPTASAQNVTLTFQPQHSNVPCYCNNTTVDVMIDIPAGMQVSYGQLGFDYNPSCGDIIDRQLNTDILTGVDPSWSIWNSPPLEDNCWDNDTDWIVYSFWIAKDGPTQALIGNFTIHCNSTDYCVSDLNFSCKPGCVQGCSLVQDVNDQPVPFNVSNGTFTCGTQETDLTVTAIDAYHNTTAFDPYHNLSNEVDVTVKNVGSTAAGASHVSLYADGSPIDTLPVPALDVDSSETVTFTWTPVGCDCEDGCSPVAYDLRAVADCDDEVAESDELNNELTVVETAYWAGYSADEHLNAVIHGTIHGGLNYTTGDGAYAGLYSGGSSQVTHYDIGQSIPSGAEVELARLNVYYTWSRDYPLMEVTITNSTDTYTVQSAAEYNDRPCDGYYGVGYDYPFGNYVYDITDYVKGESTITVSVKNVGTQMFCLSAPGIVILYEDSTKPEHEYWLVEGADLLEGGRRSGAGNLALSECISNATFTGSVDTGRVNNATLGIVSAWGGVAWGEWTSHYWLNDYYLGNGSILGGYGSLYSRTVDGISMHVGASNNAQVGANVSDVTGYVIDQDNIASFGDNGDSMLAANAFLMVEYSEQAGTPGDVDGMPGVTTNDGRQIFMYLLHGSEQYPLADPWAADCDGLCDGITTNDGRQIFMNLLHGSEQYPLVGC